MGIIFAISTTEKERNGHENFSDREVLFLILEIDFPLRRNYDYPESNKLKMVVLEILLLQSDDMR